MSLYLQNHSVTAVPSTEASAFLVSFFQFDSHWYDAEFEQREVQAELQRGYILFSSVQRLGL